MATDSYPIWWRGISAAPPASWTYLFEEFTAEGSANEWALAAAIMIAEVRERTSHGPTFAELFIQLIPDTNGVPGPFPEWMTADERKRALWGFRVRVAIEWRRRGMISWTQGVERSLAVGRAFRARAQGHAAWIIRELYESLGPTLVAALSGRVSIRRPLISASQGGPWLKTTEWRRLKFAHEMWTWLEAGAGRDVARRWFIGGNARLGEATPVMAIREDRHEEVRAAIESFIRDGLKQGNTEGSMASHRGGRPSKGERRTVSSRIAVPLATAALGRAEDLGLSMSDYIASLIAHDNNLPQFNPHRTAAERGLTASVESASPAIVARLQEVLGRDVVAIITGKTPRQVSRWVSGEAKPPLDEQRVLRDTFQVVELLAEVDPDEVVRAWFIGMNPQLEDATPAEVIAEGRARDVMAAAQAFLSAG